MLVEKALEKIVNKTFVRINDIVDKVVEKAVDKAVNQISDHVTNLVQSSLSDTSVQQKAATNAATEMRDENSGEESRQDVMEIEGSTTIAPAPLNEQDDGYDDAYLVEDDENYHAARHPCPGEIYVIHLDDYEGFVLAVDEKSDLELQCGYDASPDADRELRNRCQWRCKESKGWLCFQNVGTRKYLGIDEGRFMNHEPVLCVDFNRIGKATKFCLRRTPHGSYMLQVPYGAQLLSVKAIDYVDCLAAAWRPEKLYLRCKKPGKEEFTKWLFKATDSPQLMSYGRLR